MIAELVSVIIVGAEVIVLFGGRRGKSRGWTVWFDGRLTAEHPDLADDLGQLPVQTGLVALKRGQTVHFRHGCDLCNPGRLLSIGSGLSCGHLSFLRLAADDFPSTCEQGCFDFLEPSHLDHGAGHAFDLNEHGGRVGFVLGAQLFKECFVVDSLMIIDPATDMQAGLDGVEGRCGFACSALGPRLPGLGVYKF